MLMNHYFPIPQQAKPMVQLLNALSFRNFDGIVEQNLARLGGLSIEALVFLAPGVENGRLEGDARECPLAEGVVDRDAQPTPLGKIKRRIGLPPQRPYRGSDLRTKKRGSGRVRDFSHARIGRKGIHRRRSQSYSVERESESVHLT